MLETLWSQLRATSAPEWIGMFTGIVGVWLSVRQRVHAWPFFIVCYSAYVYLAFGFQLWAFMGINIVFVGVSLYGWSQWRKPAAALPVRHASTAELLRALAAITILTAAIAFVLTSLAEAEAPLLDAFAASCALTAQWFLSRKRIETWVFWIVADICYIYLLGKQGSLTSVLLFSTFIVLALHGWREWRSDLKNEPRHDG